MNEKVDQAKAAAAFSALGHEARLSIFRLLVRAGNDGMIVNDLHNHLAIPPSTLAHHLKMLVSSGLVIQERRGNQIVNSPNFDALTGTLSYLVDECCKGVEIKLRAA